MDLCDIAINREDLHYWQRSGDGTYAVLQLARRTCDIGGRVVTL